MGREISSVGVEVQRRQAELDQPLTKGIERRLGQAQVLGDGQVPHQGRILVDRHDPRSTRLDWRADDTGLAAHADGAGIRADGPREDLDEGALPRAVRAHERVYLAGSHGQGGVAERRDSAVALRDALCVEQWFGHRRPECDEGCRSRRHPSCCLLGSGYSPGPLQASSCSLVYVVQPGIERPRGQIGLSDGSLAAVSFSTPSGVALSHTSGVSTTVFESGA